VIDPKDKDNVYVYISGTGSVRQSEELAGCTGGDDPAANPNTSLFSIDIIKVPLAHPELAKIVSSPRIFTDSQTGAINGLWKRGNHGKGTQTTEGTDKCHDITVYAAIGLAAGACSGNGILLDIHDPLNPVRIDAVSDPNYSFWHSATFNNAGTKVLFTDEWGGGMQPRCRATDPMNWGADAIFELSNGKMKLASYYKMPAAQTEFENCVAHNGSLIPIPGRDIFVQAWYQGGMSVMDFTDTAHPVEIAYFDRGPLDATKRGMGGYWSAYWYNGYIYGSEIARGVDVFKLVPSKFITQNEIDAANQVHFDELNVQNQPKITWPSNFVVARAYIDQLTRSGALAPQRIAALNATIAEADAGRSDRKGSYCFWNRSSVTYHVETCHSRLSDRDLNRIRGESGSRQLHVHISLSGDRYGELDVDLVEPGSYRSSVKDRSVYAVDGDHDVGRAGRVESRTVENQVNLVAGRAQVDRNCRDQAGVVLRIDLLDRLATVG
jgi:hypothetical protein